MTGEAHQQLHAPRLPGGGGRFGVVVGDVLRAAGAKRPAFVTDQGIAKLPWFPTLVASIENDFAVGVFDGVWGNPVTSQVMAGVDALRAHKADAVIAVGGGAPVDVAKAIALMLHHPGHLFDYEDGKPDGRPVDQAIPYIVAMPTTAGTGSEVGRSSVVSDDETHAKKIIFSPRMLPSVVLADPELTLGLPASTTAATGFDALTHLMEAYLAKGYHPLCDGIALEGIRLVANNLATCVHYAKQVAAGATFTAAQRAEHVSARHAMLDASMMGATAFQKGLGVNHSCAHALSTVCDMHHGLANAVMLKEAMEFNFYHTQERFLAMARAVEPSASKGESFVDWFVALRGECGLPAGLKSAGIDPKHIDALVAVAIADGCHPSNPIPVTAQDFHNIFTEAFKA